MNRKYHTNLTSPAICSNAQSLRIRRSAGYGYRVLAICSVLIASTVLLAISGCKAHPPAGSVIQPQTLGTVVDQINQIQEENAEQAKLIVYMHEFEINLQEDLTTSQPDDQKDDAFQYETPPRFRGYKLTPDGQDHVRRIAEYLSGIPTGFEPVVIVERSRTSKQWNTKHRYPVHFNDDLDSARRQLIVSTLNAFGIDNAEQIVIVAPAYPTGLNAMEAGAAYRDAIGATGTTSNRFGR